MCVGSPRAPRPTRPERPSTVKSVARMCSARRSPREQRRLFVLGWSLGRKWLRSDVRGRYGRMCAHGDRGRRRWRRLRASRRGSGENTDVAGRAARASATFAGRTGVGLVGAPGAAGDGGDAVATRATTRLRRRLSDVDALSGGLAAASRHSSAYVPGAVFVIPANARLRRKPASAPRRGSRPRPRDSRPPPPRAGPTAPPVATPASAACCGAAGVVSTRGWVAQPPQQRTPGKTHRNIRPVMLMAPRHTDSDESRGAHWPRPRRSAQNNGTPNRRPPGGGTPACMEVRRF